MNIRFLETLIWLAKLKSFVKTAEKLNTTQPAISGRIAKLEEQLGTGLLIRSSAGFEFSPAGLIALEYASKIVSLYDDLQIALQKPVYDNFHARIGVLELVTLSYGSEVMEALRKRFPNATIEFSTGTSKELIEALRHKEMDLCFAIGSVDEPEIRTIPINGVALEWMANPRKFDCERNIDVLELSKLPILFGREGTSAHSHFRDYFQRNGVEFGAISTQWNFNLVYALASAVQLAKNGAGIAAVPVFLAADEVKSGNLAPMKVRQPLPPIVINVCFRRHRPDEAIYMVVSQIIQSVASEFAEPGPDGIWTWSE